MYRPGRRVCSHLSVRIATWNCCGKYDDNLRHLLDEDVDVAVVCEAAGRSALPAHQDRVVTAVSQRVWSESCKELAVVGRHPFSVLRHPASDDGLPWMLPTSVSGPVSFTLIGVWTVEFAGADGYVEQLGAVADWLERVRPAGPVVVAGDFNAPIYSSQARYEHVEHRFSKLGLVDAYRTSRGLDHGEPWTEATYFHYRHHDRPFHIDHVMLSTEYAVDAKVEVGDFETWVASGRSDHVPVIADVAFRAG